MSLTYIILGNHFFLFNSKIGGYCGGGGNFALVFKKYPNLSPDSGAEEIFESSHWLNLPWASVFSYVLIEKVGKK